MEVGMDGTTWCVFCQADPLTVVKEQAQLGVVWGGAPLCPVGGSEWSSLRPQADSVVPGRR